MLNKTETVAETNEYVLIYKPAGIAVESREITVPDLYRSLRKRYPKLHIINRIDLPVEGLVLFAKNAKSAGVLSGQLADGRMKKEYLAAVAGVPREKCGTLNDFLLKEPRGNLSRVVPEGTRGAKRACLDYETLAAVKKGEEIFSLLRILLKTGRHHQIRVQLSHMGHPIAGDRKYGFPEQKRDLRFPALCACRLSFADPASGEEQTFEVRPKGSLFSIFYENGTPDL